MTIIILSTKYTRGDKMEAYTVDFTGVRTFGAFYEALKKGLDLPDWCGQNPSAIWDMLTGHIDYPATIYLLGTSAISQNLYNEMDIIKKVFNRLLDKYDAEEFIVKIIS